MEWNGEEEAGGLGRCKALRQQRRGGAEALVRGIVSGLRGATMPCTYSHYVLRTINIGSTRYVECARRLSAGRIRGAWG